MPHVQLFLSAVSAEFRSYRDALRRPLTRPNVSVAVQEDFIATGNETLDKLDDYIKACDAVIHLVGDMSGAVAKPSAVASVCSRYPDLGERLPALGAFLTPGAPPLSYTQWEAYLAVYHRRTLIVARPDPTAPRDALHVADPLQQRAQEDHLQRLRSLGCYSEITFANEDKLAIEILRSSLHDILVAAGSAGKAINLPYPSLGSLLKGREGDLDKLRESLEHAGERGAAAIAGRALHGLGGVGKTRLAVEYAWRNAEHYTALLFVTADTPESLQRNLAALCGEQVLNLPEQNVPEEGAREAAVMRWLRGHAGWLLILDNLDTPEAGAAAEKVFASLADGHVVLTGRLSHWSAGVQAFELDTLGPDEARDFLLERTDAKRRKQADDAAQAIAVAQELGRLALALEQAGAYIAHHRLTFAAYLAEWRTQRERVIAWFDERIMHYPSSVAVTWQTSIDGLTSEARRLLDRLAWLAPEPIPESLLDVAAGGDGSERANLYEALAKLETYSLVTRSADEPTFSVHRLVQEVTRLRLNANDGNEALMDALRWINSAFIGDAQDVRSWTTLDPLASHAGAIVQHADRAQIAEPTSRLLNDLGVLLYAKGLHRMAEPLYRRGLQIDEVNYGAHHPLVAERLNNLAELLRTTNRFAEAEPLYWRALKIDEASYGADHPATATKLSNLALLLQETNRHAEAEPLLRRALNIDEASYGPDHPIVANSLNSLASLLEATNRVAEAEPLYRRALVITETSYGSHHPAFANKLNNLALLLVKTNRLAEAEPLYRHALEIDQESYGSDHPITATDLNNLAQLFHKTSRVAEAEPLYRRALKIDETTYGPDHPRVASRLNNLATLFEETNRLAEAESLYRRALEIDEMSYGPDHPDVARDLNNLAGLLRVTSKLSDAEPLCRRAVAILLTFTLKSGHEHPYLRLQRENYVVLLKESGKTDSEIEALLAELRHA